MVGQGRDWGFNAGHREQLEPCRTLRNLPDSDSPSRAHHTSTLKAVARALLDLPKLSCSQFPGSFSADVLGPQREAHPARYTGVEDSGSWKIVISNNNLDPI